MSNKIVDAVELLRLIRDGELKERNKYKCFIKWKKIITPIFIYRDEELIPNNAIERYLLDKDYTFEILSEEDEEFDIDSITEIYINDIKSVGESETKCWTGRNLDIAFANKINELIKAVKQLNKKIEE